jgi:hypothetical protein
VESRLCGVTGQPIGNSGDYENDDTGRNDVRQDIDNDVSEMGSWGPLRVRFTSQQGSTRCYGMRPHLVTKLLPDQGFHGVSPGRRLDRAARSDSLADNL